MNKIIVPTDFTHVCDVALHYAADISNTTHSQIFALHIVKSESEVPAAKTKLNALIAQHKNDSDMDLQPLLVVGNIFDDIPHVAEKEEADLIVMGTHGMHGMQFIVGSNALRVITESKVPVIIVQDGNRKGAKIKKVLVPMDLHQETKQKLVTACDMADRFGAEIHLVTAKEEDEFLKNKLVRNVAFAEAYIEGREVPYRTVITEGGINNFIRDMLKYGDKEEIDLICIMNTAEERLMHAFGMDIEQKLITNAYSIPVMVVNPSQIFIDKRSILAQ